MSRRAAFLLMLLVPLVLAGPSAAAVISEVLNYRKAFALLDAGHADRAVVFTEKGHDRVLNNVLFSAYMATPGNPIDFGQMALFVKNHPDWPNLRGIVAIAEQKIPQTMSAEETITWFTSHPPVTLNGFYRFIDALESNGDTQNVAGLIRTRLIDGEFSADDLSTYYTRFSRYLDAGSMAARLDKLDWKNDGASARRMYGYVDIGHRALSDARLALANKAFRASSTLSDVPADLADDPGFLFEKTRWFQRNNRDDDAVQMLRHAPDDLGNADAWWDVRQTMIRRMMERRDYKTAYELAVDNGQTDQKTVTQADFLAGWLALRFLNEPEKAAQHFKDLYDNATTPITRARGGYWLGRAHETLGDKQEAAQSYEDAATFYTTYYGQLAATRIAAHPVIEVRAEGAISTSVRSAFFGRDSISAIQRLHNLGEDKHANAFFKASVDAASKRSDFALLIELAYQLHRPDLAIEAYKAAIAKNIVMGAGGFPLLAQILPRPPEPAFIHALIRQESMFNPRAESPVGAQGLMQLMPATAKAVARQCGVKYKESRLCDLDYNLRLGTAFVQSQLNVFNGSYVLTLAAYNAGPGRVREWLDEIGDPRSPAIDPVDWVEEIPIPETRNYVQRIIESVEVYRAKLNGGEAPLTIMGDLRR